MSSPESFGIFVSYRRDETAGYAGRLHDSLIQRFGPSCVFMDVDSIEPGVDFVDPIDEALARSTVLLPLIGPHWLDASDREGAPRIDQADASVPSEIAVSLD